ncbi:hypothetical protein Sjap_020595 [Stephania japonica]|uniref:Uncharacterized protein n=1 Tax=Stephania japonica TaxID=461633 RepID=A0AAP0F0Z7_9MAGN
MTAEWNGAERSGPEQSGVGATIDGGVEQRQWQSREDGGEDGRLGRGGEERLGRGGGGRPGRRGGEERPGRGGEEGQIEVYVLAEKRDGA